MGFSLSWNWALDGWIVLAGILCATASSLIGSFLVLRRMSLLGDAISHAVLPGLAAAFFISGSRNSVVMFVGAAMVGVLTALLTQWIRNYGNVDEGASMGVVFTTLFALGLVMIVQAADHVDLDPSCVLYGAIELTPLDTWLVLGYDVPRVVVTLSIVTLVNLVFIILFYKEFKISAFDPSLATASGFNASLMHYLLMTLVAVTAVASFESVGNILVIAMMVVPASAAMLLSERLVVVIFISVLIAVISAILGHISALVVPPWFGFRSTTTAGMMAVVVGLIFALVSLFAPKQGVLVRFARHRLLGLRILSEDVIAALYRREEQGHSGSRREELCQTLLANSLALRIVTWWQARVGQIRVEGERMLLTRQGRQLAGRLVRSHRLWEHYLVDQAGVPVGRIHDQAERLEHFTDAQLRQRLDEEGNSPDVDPHGREIPGDG